MALIQPVVDGKIPKDTSTTSKSDTSNDLGYDQFLQLLCAEMQYQDRSSARRIVLSGPFGYHAAGAVWTCGGNRGTGESL